MKGKFAAPSISQRFSLIASEPLLSGPVEFYANFSEPNYNRVESSPLMSFRLGRLSFSSAGPSSRSPSGTGRADLEGI